MQHDETHATHTLGYGLYVMVWLALVVLTGLTVVIAGVNLAALTVAVAILIAGIKSMLVVNYFMHIGYEHPFFKVMVGVCLVTFIIFIGLTFSDFAFR